MTNKIYLVGPMGVGKTTVGRKIAHKLSCDFLDTDQIIETRTGVSISHIFDLEGEEGFRVRETKLLTEIAQDGSELRVVATGGGMILRQANRDMMRQSGRVIYLRADAEHLWNRLRQRTKRSLRHRPLLDVDDLKTTITELLEVRAPLYQKCADFSVDVCVIPPHQVIAEICGYLDDQLP